MTTDLPALPADARAALYAQLAALEDAGLPPSRAFALLKLDRAVQSRVETAGKLLSKGVELPRAGERAGLFTALDAALIHAAWSAGSPARTYRRLADFYTEQANRMASIKARLWLPAVVFVLALMVAPLPKLFAGTLSGGEYAMEVLRPLAMVAATIYLLLQLPGWLRGGSAKPLLDTLLLQMPLFGAMHVRRNARDFFESVALMVEAGMPILDALPKALATLDNSVIQRDFAQILPRVRQGSSLAEAIKRLRYAGGERPAAFIRTGEESGTLPEMLFRHTRMETDALRNFYEQVAAWLPRIVYGVLAAWMIHGLLTGPGIVPQLPPDLQ